MGGSALWPGRRSREVLLKACANDGKDWDAAAAVFECRTDMALVVWSGGGDVCGDGEALGAGDVADKKGRGGRLRGGNRGRGHGLLPSGIVGGRLPHFIISQWKNEF